MSYSIFFHCTYLFVLYFDYLNRTLVARTPRLAISEMCHLKRCIMIFTKISLKSIIKKVLKNFTRISLKSIINKVL